MKYESSVKLLRDVKDPINRSAVFAVIECMKIVIGLGDLFNDKGTVVFLKKVLPDISHKDAQKLKDIFINVFNSNLEQMRSLAETIAETDINARLRGEPNEN